MTGRAGLVNTTPGGVTSSPLGNIPQIIEPEECGDCGRHSIIEAHDVDLSGQRTYRRKCLHCGSRNIIPAGETALSKPANNISNKSTQPTTEPTPATVCNDNNKMLERKEEHRKGGCMTKENKTCKWPGCSKWGSFDSYCAAHFRETHGISYSDYQRERKAGKSKEAIFASVKGSKPSKDLQHFNESENVAARIDAMSELGKCISDSMTVSVDFTHHQDLLDAIEAIAESDFRTPSQQILYLISQADKILQRAHEAA
jgi:hypothetical protein